MTEFCLLISPLFWPTHFSSALHHRVSFFSSLFARAFIPPRPPSFHLSFSIRGSFPSSISLARSRPRVRARILYSLARYYVRYKSSSARALEFLTLAFALSTRTTSAPRDMSSIEIILEFSTGKKNHQRTPRFYFSIFTALNRVLLSPVKFF